jgi:hypothetical protein
MGRPKGSKNKPKVTESAPSVVETNTENKIETYAQTGTTTKRTAAEMKEWYAEKGFLRDTVLSCQDKFYDVLKYFRLDKTL